MNDLGGAKAILPPVSKTHPVEEARRLDVMAAAILCSTGHVHEPGLDQLELGPNRAYGPCVFLLHPCVWAHNAFNPYKAQFKFSSKFLLSSNSFFDLIRVPISIKLV